MNLVRKKKAVKGRTEQWGSNSEVRVQKFQESRQLQESRGKTGTRSWPTLPTALQAARPGSVRSHGQIFELTGVYGIRSESRGARAFDLPDHLTCPLFSHLTCPLLPDLPGVRRSRRGTVFTFEKPTMSLNQTDTQSTQVELEGCFFPGSLRYLTCPLFRSTSRLRPCRRSRDLTCPLFSRFSLVLQIHPSFSRFKALPSLVN